MIIAMKTRDMPIAVIEADNEESSATTDTRKKENAHEFSLRVSEGALSVLLDCTVPTENVESLAIEICEELSMMKIADLPTIDDISKRLNPQALGGSALSNAVLIQGKAPSPPKDATIEWEGDFFNTGFVVDEKTGQIDYHLRAAQTSVTQGQLLARLMPPEPGKDGRDVFGKRIPATPPEVPKISPGQNIRHDKESDSFYAKETGHFRWTEGVLSVDLVYTISGNVDLESGNISHPGAVLVIKDVLEGFEIEAAGNVEVQGIIDGGSIRTDGDLLVHGGISGGQKQNITVGGSIHAKYILDATIEAVGDVIAEREIVQSCIKTRGAVRVPNGRIVGGDILALGGIEVKQAGTPASVPGKLTVGEDYLLERKLSAKHEEMEPLQKNLKRICKTLEPVLQNKELLASGKKKLVEVLTEQQLEMEKAIQVLQEECEQLRAESQKLSLPRIQINDILYSDTILCINSAKRKVRKAVDTEFKGPLKAIYLIGDIKLVAASEGLPEKPNAG